MAILPETDFQKLQFCVAHAPVWVTNAAAIGVVPANATAFQTKTDAAQTAYDAMITARNAAKAATLNFYNKATLMTDDARGLIATIKAYADLRNDPNVYVLAEIPAPATPSPVPAPATPTDLTGVVDASGRLTLTWKSTRRGASTGIFFEVSRKVGSELNFTVIHAGAEVSYEDPAFPTLLASSGGNTISYRVRAIRGEQSSAGFAGPLEINLVGESASSVVGSIGGSGVSAAAA